MRRIAAFIKATTIGGLFVLLPVVVVVGVAARTVLGVRGAAQSAMEKILGEHSGAAHFPMLFAVLIVIGISFALGLAMISRHGKRAGSWIERALLFRIPGYPAVRAIVHGLSNIQEDGVRPALLTLEEGLECFALVTEVHPDGRLTVFIPSSPNPSSGNVQIAHPSRVQFLQVPVTKLLSPLQRWGVGAQSVLAKHHGTPAIIGSGSPQEEDVPAPAIGQNLKPNPIEAST